MRKITSELPENSEVYVRIYNPIEYKQSTYTGDARFRPPICTSLGQKTTNFCRVFSFGWRILGFFNPRISEILAKINNRETQICVKAERAFLRGLGASCSTPVAVNAVLKNGKLNPTAAKEPLRKKSLLLIDIK